MQNSNNICKVQTDYNKRKRLTIITRTFSQDGSFALDDGKYKDVYLKNNSFLSDVKINNDIKLGSGEVFSVGADRDFFTGSTFGIVFVNPDASNALLVVLTKYDIE